MKQIINIFKSMLQLPQLATPNVGSVCSLDF